MGKDKIDQAIEAMNGSIMDRGVINTSIDKSRDFNEKGKFKKGNQVSRGNKSVKIDKDALTKAMSVVATEEETEFLVQALRMAYKYPQVMCKLLDKFFSDLSIAELKGDPGAWNVFITLFNEKKREEKATEEKELNSRP